MSRQPSKKGRSQKARAELRLLTEADAKKQKVHHQRVLFSLVMVQVLFGIHYVVSKIVISQIPPLVWASGRAVLTAVLMVGICLLARRPHPKPTFQFFGPLLIFSFLAVVLNQAFFLVGLSMTSSTNASILNTLIPVFTLLFVTLRGQEQLTPKRVVGFLFAFFGVLILFHIENFSISPQTITGDLFILINCICYASFLSYGKNFLEKYDNFWVTAWLFVFGSIGLSLLAVPQWLEFQSPVWTTELILCTLYGVIGASLFTYFLNNFALANTRASDVALFIYIQPIIASALAYFWLGEQFTDRTLLTCTFVFVGIFLCLSRQKSKKRGSSLR